MIGFNRRLYCYKCNKTIRSFRGVLRDRALAKATVTRERLYVSVILFGEVLAYARDEPNLELVECRDGNWHYRKVGRSTYCYFVHGSSLVAAMGFDQCHHVSGFKTLKQATAAMLRYLGLSPAKAGCIDSRRGINICRRVANVQMR